jgi:hypothetical protein
LPPAPQAQETTLSGIRSLQDTKGHEVIPPTPPLRFSDGQAQPAGPKSSLLSVPIELAGIWGASPPNDVARVLSRTREACLSGLNLLSDRQPDRIRVDNHTSGPPAIWLHNDNTRMAWIIVDVGPLDWSKLAYQFGHELGHVLCNSWEPSAKRGPPSQWLEEAMVEAFSIRGLGLLATGWERNPPFPGDARFAVPLRKYRGDLIEKYAKPTELAPGADLDSWFRAYRSLLELGNGEPEGPAVLGVLTLLESDPASVEDLGAVNRWPSRTGVSIEAYLNAWEKSCTEIGTPGLPVRLRNLLHLG